MKRKRKLKKLLAILMTVVMMTSMVNLSAFAGEQDPAPGESGPALTCELTEHTHSEACYGVETITDENGNPVEQTVLTCGLTEHTHGPECYATGSSDPADNPTTGEPSVDTPSLDNPITSVPEDDGETDEAPAALAEWEHYAELTDGLADLRSKIGEFEANFTYDGADEDYQAALTTALAEEFGDELDTLDKLFNSIPEEMQSDDAYADLKGNLENIKAELGIEAETSGDPDSEIMAIGNGTLKVGETTYPSGNATPTTISGGTIEVTGTWYGSLVINGNTTITGGGTINASQINDTNKSVITVKNNATVTLENATITGGEGTLLGSNGLETRGNKEFRAGGGVYVESGTFILNGGTITENTAQRGGGIFVNNHGGSAGHLEMTGGIISNNSTVDKVEGDGFAGEGGGIFVWGTARIEGGKIINNTCNSTYDLGGGGLYVNNTGIATLINAKITNNTAAGLGGGIAGCCHGEMSLVATDGVALYGNTANGRVRTLGRSSGYANATDHYNEAHAKGINGDNSADFYTAGNSIISNYMAGGGSAQYEAKINSGDPIKIKDDEVRLETTEVALKAFPTEESIAKIPENCVEISGNTSTMHGGGVGCNGGLYFGSAENSIVKFRSLSLELNAMKELRGGVLKDGDYTFRLLYNDKITEAATATNKDGVIDFNIEGNIDERFLDLHNTEADENLGDTENSITFYLEEVVNPQDKTVAYDNSMYQIKVNLKGTVEDGETKRLEHTTGQGFNNITVTYKYITYTIDGAPTITKVRDAEGKDIQPGEVLKDNEKATFVNQALGNLRVEKTVMGNDAEAEKEEGKEFGFIVKLFENEEHKAAEELMDVNGTYGSGDAAMKFEHGTATFSLKGGEHKEATNLPAGISYTVEEVGAAAANKANEDGYETNSENETGTIPENDTATATFRNIKGHPEKVETDPGDKVPVEVGQEITYEIYWVNWKATKQNVEITDAIDEAVDFVDATPKDEQGEPVGWTYDEKTRIVTWDLGEQDAGASGTVTLTVRVNVKAIKKVERRVTNQAYVVLKNSNEGAFTNIPENPVLVGDLSITKAVGGEDGERTREWNFTLTISDADGNPMDLDKTYGDMYFTDGVAHFTLKDDETKIARGLPAGAKYTLEEEDASDDGYETSIDSQEGTIKSDKIKANETIVLICHNDREPTPHKNEIAPGNGIGVKLGEEITYEIEWKNWTKNPDGAVITIKDPLDEAVDFVSATEGGIYDPVTHTVNWNLGRKYYQDKGTVQLTVRVNEKIFEDMDHEITNIATVYNDSDSKPTDETKNPTKEGDLIVTKIVSGNDGDKEAVFHFTVELGSKIKDGTYGEMEFKDGVATFTLMHGQSKKAEKLPAGITYKVTETEANQDGYSTSTKGDVGEISENNTATAEFENHRSITTTTIPGPSTTSVTVNKAWVGDEDANVRPDSIQVQLYKNGAPYESPATLNAPSWTYTWTGLEIGASYTVVELNVPAGYTSLVDQNGQNFTITNTWNPVPLGGALNVTKVWKGDNAEVRPDSIEVQLYKDGNAEGDPVTLNEENDWSYSWTELDPEAEYTVEEADVPEGYQSSVEADEDGINFTITNTYDDDEELEQLPDPDVPLANMPSEPSKTTVTTIPNPSVPLASRPSSDSSVTIEDTAVPLGDAPKTGDESPIALWTVLMLGSLLSAAMIRMYLAAKRREQGRK